MKRVTKIFSIVLVAVMMATLLCGCESLFTKDNARYRATEAITIGNQSLSLGKILDAYNNAYYQYYYYIYYGYMDAASLFENVMHSLFNEYVKVSAYIDAHQSDAVTPSSDYLKGFANAKYLSSSELEYAVKSSKYALYTAFDSYVEGYASEAGYTLGTVEEETKRTYLEYDNDGDEIANYVDYLYAQCFVNEDMSDYMTDYYAYNDSEINGKIEYVFASETAGATAKVKELNDRINAGMKDEEGFTENPVTFQQYKAWQEKAVTAYTKTAQNNYNSTLEGMLNKQLENVIDSLIANKYDYELAKNEFDGIKSGATTAFNSLKDAKEAEYNVNENTFVTDIEGLTATSYVYNVPETYDVTKTQGGEGNGYVFVRNILIPFSDGDKAYLANVAKRIGNTSSDEYLAAREERAEQIIAKDFNDNESEVSGLFTYNPTTKKVEINQGTANALNEVFDANGLMKSGKGDSDVVALMKQFNTDTAQHTATYQYVVRVGDVPSSYNAKWVSEFVDATNDAYDASSTGNSYGICVSTYGIHIVYYSKPVAADEFDVSEITDPTSTSYRFFKTYYSDVLSGIKTNKIDSLMDSYKADGKINANEEFDKFLTDNSIDFDLDAFLAE